ncbi:unnamed protein product [Eruca vesicaria subsp. sativa]|uniref:Folate receptor-like domain-containing protein n=1 Tax=Eruca vesicaria subsp. sativa TaxID=29727 RepID=A0ABC8LQP1_ERUVS|nr:unnamed protein product [Eruca vesicaria subsp. sativa]
MRGYSTKKMMFLQLLTPIMLLHLFISSSSGEESVNSSENRVCVSKGGRYELEGKLPKFADLEFKDLNMCNVFHGKTCCSASQMLSVSLALQNLAVHGEASKECLFWFELLECSICHPDVGTQLDSIRICASFCDSVFEACSDAYFTSDDTNQVIVPCGASNGIICVKVSKWGTNGTAFCDALGFTVQTADDSPCYGSKTSLESMVKLLTKTENGAWFQDLKKLVSEMTLSQQFSWVATFTVLGTMLFNRWRYQQQMQAMIQRDARRLIRNNMNGRI